MNSVARGPHISEDALIDALNAGEIRAAGLDVTETEPGKQSSPHPHLILILTSPYPRFHNLIITSSLSQSSNRACLS